MGPMSPQGDRPAGMRTRRWATTVVAALAIVGCDGAPPRVKPWRHAPDPLAVAESVPRSPVLAKASDDVAVKARRAHTLRIHVDAEPRGLNPLLSPSVWTRRIMMGTVFETLLREAPPEGGAGSGPGRYLPGLARSWRIMPGGREIRFELEPDVTFQDRKSVV